MNRIALLAIVLSAAACTDDSEPAGSCTTQMFSKYGQSGFEAVNSKIIENVVAVSSINPSPIGDSFKALGADDVARVEANLLDFLIFVYGGPNNYQGKDMTAAHVGLDITDEQYDAFVGMVIVPALQSAGVDADDITDCFAPPVVDASFKASMVGK
jgi:hemoglobin